MPRRQENEMIHVDCCMKYRKCKLGDIPHDIFMSTEFDPS